MIIPLFDEVRRYTIQPQGLSDVYKIGDQENQEVQKLIERNVEYEHAFNHYIKLHPQSCRDCLTKFAGL